MSDTAVVGAATLVSRVLGFLRNAVVGALFGQTWKADVLTAVFNIPFNLRKLVAEGALSTAFIPVLSHTLETDPTRTSSRALVRSMVTLQCLVLLPLTALAIVFAQPLVSVLAPFPEPERQALAAELFRWFIPYLFLVSMSAIMMGVLNTHQRFAVPAISPVLFSLFVILSLLLLFPLMDIYSQIPGVLVGGLAQIVFQWFFFRRLGYTLLPTRHFWTVELKQILAKWGPALSTSGIALVNQQVSMSLAALLPEGSVAALGNAIVFWQLPAGVLSASIITVFYPRMSRQFAQGKPADASISLGQALRLLLFLLVPAGVFLGLFAQPLVALAFQRGQFTPADSLLAGKVLTWMSWGLFLSGGFSLFQRYFFASGDFKTPLRVSLAWAVSDLAVSLTLMWTSLGVQGLAIGGVVGFLVGASLTAIMAYRRKGFSGGWSHLWFLLRVALAILPVVLVFQWSLTLTGSWWSSGLTLSSAGWFVLEGSLAIVMYLGGTYFLGIRARELFAVRTRKEGEEDAQ